MAAGHAQNLIVDLVASTAAAIVMSRTWSERDGVIVKNPTMNLRFAVAEHLKPSVPLKAFSLGYCLTVKIYCAPQGSGASRPRPIGSAFDVTDPRQDLILIETWRIRWEERRPTDRVDRSANEMAAFIRAVYSMLRMLPAYREFRRSDRLSYEFDTFRGDDSLWMNPDRRIERLPSFAVVNHPLGRLEASVAYYKIIPERPEEIPRRMHAPATVDAVPADSPLELAMRTPLTGPGIATSPPAPTPHHVLMRHPSEPVFYSGGGVHQQPVSSQSADSIPLQHRHPSASSALPLLAPRTQTPPSTRRDVHQYEAGHPAGGGAGGLSSSPTVYPPPPQLHHPGSHLPFHHQQQQQQLPHQHQHPTPSQPLPLHVGSPPQAPGFTDYHHRGSPLAQSPQFPFTDASIGKIHQGSPTRQIQVPPSATDYQHHSHHQGSPIGSTRPVQLTSPPQIFPPITDYHRPDQYHQGSPHGQPLPLPPWKLDRELLHPNNLSDIKPSSSFALRQPPSEECLVASSLFRRQKPSGVLTHPLSLFTHSTRMSLSALPTIQQPPSEALEHPAFFQNSRSYLDEEEAKLLASNSTSDVSSFLEQCRQERLYFPPRPISPIEDLAKHLADFRQLE